MEIDIAARQREPDPVSGIMQQLRRREAGHCANEPVALRQRRREAPQQRMLTPASHQMMQRHDVHRRHRVVVLKPPGPAGPADLLAQAKDGPRERIGAVFSPHRGRRSCQMFGQPAAGQTLIVGGGRLQHGARQQDGLIRPLAGAGQRVLSRDRVPACEHGTARNVRRGNHRHLRRRDGNSATGEDFPVRQAGRAGDLATAKALDADRQEVARQVALNQHRGATAAQQIT
jgi:hypothetical protein